MSLLPKQAGVLISSLLILLEIGIDDLLAVQFNGNLPPLGDDTDLVPFAVRLGHVLGWTDYIINRPGKLRRPEVFPVRIVQELNLHADVGRISLHGAA